jgi:hypothetical protein
MLIQRVKLLGALALLLQPQRALSAVSGCCLCGFEICATDSHMLLQRALPWLKSAYDIAFV